MSGEGGLYLGGGGLKYKWYKKHSFLNELIRNKLRLTKSIIKMHFPLNGL